MDFSKSLPVVLFILIGVVAGRRYALDKRSFSTLLLYFVSPLVFFETTWGSQVGVASLGLPMLIWLVASLLGVAAYRIAQRYMGAPDTNLLGFAMGACNSGYFGLPVAAALYGEAFLPHMVLVIMGFSLFEYTTGFYITARSHFSVRASLRKLFSLPPIYAFLLGLLLNELGVVRGEFMNPLSVYLRGAYSFMGLVVLGLGLADISWKNFDARFLAQAFLSRLLVWPIAVALLVLALRLDPRSDYFKALALVAFLPTAANGVVIATELKAAPYKIAGAIAVSTLVSIILLNLNMHLKFIELLGGMLGS